MKRGWIFGLALMALGSILFLIAFAAAGWDITAMSTRPERLEKNYTAQAELSNICIDEGNGNLRVVPSPDEKVHILYFESEEEGYSIREENGTLEIVYQDRSELYRRIFDINFQEITMTIQVPKEFAGEVNLRTRNGDVEIKQVEAGSTQVFAESGKILLDDFDADSLVLEADNGKITVENLAVAGELEAQSDNGSVEARNVTCANARVTADNGNLQIEGLAAEDIVEVEARNGAIRVEELEFGTACTLEADNGAIRGTLPGKTVEYTIQSVAENGENSLPENLAGGEKQLTVIAKNGRIDIAFVDDAQ